MVKRKRKATFKCSECKKFLCYTKFHYLNHLLYEHRSVLVFWCDRCEVGFDGANEFVCHVSAKTCKKSLVELNCCIEGCSYTTTVGRELLKHFKSTHRGNIYTSCFTCNKCFTLPHNYIIHLQKGCESNAPDNKISDVQNRKRRHSERHLLEDDRIKRPEGCVTKRTRLYSIQTNLPIKSNDAVKPTEDCVMKNPVVNNVPLSRKCNLTFQCGHCSQRLSTLTEMHKHYLNMHKYCKKMKCFFCPEISSDFSNFSGLYECSLCKSGAHRLEYLKNHWKLFHHKMTFRVKVYFSNETMGNGSDKLKEHLNSDRENCSINKLSEKAVEASDKEKEHFTFNSIKKPSFGAENCISNELSKKSYEESDKMKEHLMCNSIKRSSSNENCISNVPEKTFKESDKVKEKKLDFISIKVSNSDKENFKEESSEHCSPEEIYISSSEDEIYAQLQITPKIKKHVKTEITSNNFSCDKCSFVGFSIDQLNEHNFFTHSSMSCTHCGAMCGSFKLLQNHHMWNHGDCPHSHGTTEK